MITEQQSIVIKKQILAQLEKSLPPNKYDELKSYILELNPEELEEFLQRNNIKFQDEINQSEPIEANQTQQNVFRMIVEGKIKSYKIAENSVAIAVLDINPKSFGHSIIIPKQHITKSEKLPTQCFTLARLIAKKIKTILKAKEVHISASTILDHAIITLIPMYSEGTKLPDSGKLTNDELAVLQDKLNIVQKKQTRIKKQKHSNSNNSQYILPRRKP